MTSPVSTTSGRLPVTNTLSQAARKCQYLGMGTWISKSHGPTEAKESYASRTSPFARISTPTLCLSDYTAKEDTTGITKERTTSWLERTTQSYVRWRNAMDNKSSSMSQRGTSIRHSSQAACQVVGSLGLPRETLVQTQMEMQNCGIYV